MKRSEMIEVIEKVLADSTSWPSDRRVAEVILEKIEAFGMLPPTTFEPGGETARPADLYVVNKWDKE